MSEKQGWKQEFDERFVEFAPDGSKWGAGLRIKHTGTTRDRETLDEIKSFISKLLKEKQDEWGVK